LRLIAEALDGARADLVGVADLETGLGEVRLNGELTRTCFQLEVFASVLAEGSYLEAMIDHAGATPMGSRPDLRRMLVPIGPVAVFAASNFPFAFSVAGGDTASAIAAGCPVLVKAHPSHPQLSDAVAGLLIEVLTMAGAPRGTLAVLHGFAAGRRLVTHPEIRAVGFTGSASGGRALDSLARGRPDPIPFYGELSGINPLVVTPAACAERAQQIAVGLADSVCLGGGQFCTKPGVVLLPAGPDGDRLLALLCETVTAREPAVALNAGIAAAYQRGVSDMREEGATLVAEGASAPPDGDGFWMRPAVLTAEADKLTGRALEEVFGPAVLVTRYPAGTAGEEIGATLRRLPAALTATVHASDGDPLADLLAGVLAEHAGRVVWNGYPTGVAVSWAMQHGGPAPATTNSLHTSVGPTAIRRFLRPVVWQDAPPDALPAELADDWHYGTPRAVDPVPRRVDGVLVLPET
jgi:NADP-dependent aldehyde dehydrogenase